MGKGTEKWARKYFYVTADKDGNEYFGKACEQPVPGACGKGNVVDAVQSQGEINCKCR